MKAIARTLAAILVISIMGWFPAAAQAQALGAGFTQAGTPAVKGKVYSFAKIADGVYYTTSGWSHEYTRWRTTRLS